eukprot:TRINITY_DN15555_c0_g1_i1.p1 TRINITY_DN15555_c0_g1~~TRINITY_DN15555_c0_g1_i1.p1  ORF type:complete len:1059 (+),score=200.70 TRINITY_DN15555_c0_g1_i1:45-3179(+)
MDCVFSSNVAVIGARSLGAEVSKNLLLAGIRSLLLVDGGQVEAGDLAAHFLLGESDMGQNRAAVCVERLREFNSEADVRAAGTLEDPYLEHCHAVVATTGTIEELANVNDVCRKRGIFFIAALVHGLFSSIFVDLGDHFSVKDSTLEPRTTLLVESITEDFPATVTLVDEHRHGLEDGDSVIFTGVKGMVELNDGQPRPVTVTGTSSFTIPDDTRNYGRYLAGGYLQVLHPAKQLDFKPLSKSILSPSFVDWDPAGPSRSAELHLVFRALDAFRSKHRGKEPSAYVNDHIAEILKITSELCASDCGAPRTVLQDASTLSAEDRHASTSESWATSHAAHSLSRGHEQTGATDGAIGERFVRAVLAGLGAELSPVVSIAGGIASQEVLKACTRVMTPIRQWLHFDALDCQPEHAPSQEERIPSGSRYDSQVAVFGKELQEKFSSLQWLVVGAGGIGCEVLKNLVLMGVGCGSGGRINVIDMDHVERSNLCTQMLYRSSDIGQPKAVVATKSVRKINPAAQVEAFSEKFEAQTDSLFDANFFERLSGVCSAVDNATTRLHLDSRCVHFRRPMIDGGKHGSKGSVQVFVPYKSEMYASTRDPPEHREPPICTLKNFPYSPEHTLKWALDTFEFLFQQQPSDVNSYLTSREFLENVRKSPPATQQATLETLRNALVTHKPLSFEACVEWARLQFEELFSNNIKQLCFNFPPGMTTTAGAPFWSGTKRAPQPLSFDADTPLHLDFIVAAANLQATVYGLKGRHDRAAFVDMLKKVEVPAFVPKENVKIAVTDAEASRNFSKGAMAAASVRTDDAAIVEKCEAILREMPTPGSLAGYRLTTVMFSKEDEQNFHVDFVLAAANLRACNYGIPPCSKLQARIVTGRILPAIITSTAVVGGLMCLELYKLVQEKPLSVYRHSFFNLALPMFASAQPTPAVSYTVATTLGKPLVWTLWDRFEVDGRGVTLEGALELFKAREGLEITMMSHGKSLVYAEFLQKKKIAERMPLLLTELVSTVGKMPLPMAGSRLTFSVSCTDANGEDVEVPDVTFVV